MWLKKLESLEKKLRLTESELDLRSYIKVLQQKTIPIRLLNAEFESAFIKWAVSLEFHLTQGAKIILSRLAKFQCPVGMLDVVDTLALMYDALSETIQHNRTSCPIKLNDYEWKSLFDKIQVDDPQIEEIFKKIVKPITKEEREQCNVGLDLIYWATADDRDGIFLYSNKTEIRVCVIE